MTILNTSRQFSTMTTKLNYIQAKDAKRSMVIASKPITHQTTGTGTITRCYVNLSIPNQPSVSKGFIQLKVPCEAFLTRKPVDEKKKNSPLITKLNVMLSDEDIVGLKELDIGVKIALAPFWKELGERFPFDDRTFIRGTYFIPVDEKTEKPKEGARPMMSLKLYDDTIFSVIYSDSVDQNGHPIPKTKFLKKEEYDGLLKKKLRCSITFHLRDVCPSPKGLSTQCFIASCIITEIDQRVAPNDTLENNNALAEYLRSNPAKPLNMGALSVVVSDTTEVMDDDSEFKQSKIGKSEPPPSFNFGNKLSVPTVDNVVQQMNQLNLASEQQQYAQQQYIQQPQYAQQPQYVQQTPAVDQQSTLEEQQRVWMVQQQQQQMLQQYGQAQAPSINSFLPQPGQLNVTMQKI